VPNLKPGRVTVVDQHAKQLSAGEDGFAGQAADGRRSEVEQRIAKTVKGLVEGVVGSGKARVNVKSQAKAAKSAGASAPKPRPKPPRSWKTPSR